MGKHGLTEFESEIIDCILWLLEGQWSGRVTLRATNRILRASLRRVVPSPVATSDAARGLNSASLHKDHAIPLREVAEIIVSRGRLSRAELEALIRKYIVLVTVTRHEHTSVLKAAGLAEAMPSDWDGNDVFARYTATGISLRVNT